MVGLTEHGEKSGLLLRGGRNRGKEKGWVGFGNMQIKKVSGEFLFIFICACGKFSNLNRINVNFIIIIIFFPFWVRSVMSLCLFSILVHICYL